MPKLTAAVWISFSSTCRWRWIMEPWNTVAVKLETEEDEESEEEYSGISTEVNVKIEEGSEPISFNDEEYEGNNSSVSQATGAVRCTGNGGVSARTEDSSRNQEHSKVMMSIMRMIKGDKLFTNGKSDLCDPGGENVAYGQQGNYGELQDSLQCVYDGSSNYDDLCNQEDPKGTEETAQTQCYMCGEKFNNTTFLAMHLYSHNQDPNVGNFNDRTQSCSQDFESLLKNHGMGKDCLPWNTRRVEKDLLEAGNSEEFVDYQGSNVDAGNFQVSTAVNSNLTGLEVPKCSSDVGNLGVTKSVVGNTKFPSIAKPKGGNCNKLSSAQAAKRKRSNEKRFFCDVCKKGFARKSHVGVHVRIHTGERPYHCEICEKRFTRKGDLETHSRTHSKVRPHQCELCEKTFSQKTNLMTHMRTHTKEKNYFCEICGKTFSQKGNLTCHIRIHTGDKPFLCSICGKAFKQSHELKSHLVRHSGVKPFCCELCGKRFSLKPLLEGHLKRHGNEKPFPCELCNKYFKVKGDLREHIKTHEGLKPYHCSTCGKGFSSTGNLKTHIRSHTGEKPYPCPNCGKCFSQSSSVKVHVKSHCKGN